MGKPETSLPMQKTKLHFGLEVPYKEVHWPNLSPDAQSRILDLLCNLLSPIGQHRTQTVVPSKGRQARKRKRAEASADGKSSGSLAPDGKDQDGTSCPPIQKYLTIGYNETHRHLEAQVQRNKMRNPAHPDPGSHAEKAPFVRAVFAIRGDQAPILFHHLPLLVSMASDRYGSDTQPVRLVSLSKDAGHKLASALNLPRVTLIGLLEGSPDAEALLNLIQGEVETISIPWHQKASLVGYQPVSIKTTEATTPVSSGAQTSKVRSQKEGG